MASKQQIQEDIKKALKEQNELSRSVLRMLLAEIVKSEIELGKKEEGLNEEEVGRIVLREIKKRGEAVEQYKKGGRDDLAEQEVKEAAVLQEYAPKQASEEELNSLINDIIKDVGAKNPADTGRVIKEVMARVEGYADGSLVSRLVKEKLQEGA